MTNDNGKKVALFIGSDITAHLVLNKIVPEMIDNGFRPVIFMPEHKSSKKANLPELKKMAFFERKILAEVVYPYLNGLTERSKPLAPEILAKKYNLKYIPVPDINDPEFVRRQKDASDYVGALSVRCFQIFKPEHIQVWRDKGFLLNLHPGILPEYQGVMSVARAIAEPNETRYGWTLHYIDEGIDTGNILAKRPIQIDRTKTVLRSTIDMVDTGALAITRIFEDLQNGGLIEGNPQPSRGHGANYFTYPTAAELKKWENDGLKLVDPEEVVQLYTNIFSDPHTSHGKGLKSKLREAIEAAGFDNPPSSNDGYDNLRDNHVPGSHSNTAEKNEADETIFARLSRISWSMFKSNNNVAPKPSSP